MRIQGELTVHYEGYGFVVPIKPGQADVFVPARWIGDAMHRDIVEVEARPSKKGLLEGRIVKIVERGMKQFLGHLESHGRHWFVIGEDKRVRHRLVVRDSGGPKLRQGLWVVAKIMQYPMGEKLMEGIITEILPPRGTLATEIDYVIAKHQWPRTFPEAVEREASLFKHESPTQHAPRDTRCERKDLKPLPFVTIDGDDAKDFDDAVCAAVLPEGKVRVWIAIADVSAYVVPRTVIDKEGLARATSVYFPGRVLPMLPEILSNDRSSLRPGEERAVLVAEMVISRNGELESPNFYPAVIESHARLTYRIVKRILIDGEAALRKQYDGLLPTLEAISQAAHLLREKRLKRGTLDFDLPEPEIILDLTGGIEDIVRTSRNWSHQIIEELMIAANEAVALFLTKRLNACIYRIHELPDPRKVDEFYKFVWRLGYEGRRPQQRTPKEFSPILNHFRGKTKERVVNSVLLRSMAQAVYSAENLGHFGLASPCYCHFTSPIRRYPDLVVHRLLKIALSSEVKVPGDYRTGVLEQIADHCSRQERRAMEAEREMVALHVALFMREKIGQTFSGVISHVAKFGLFVELEKFFVEGLIPKEALTGDLFQFDEEHLCYRGKKTKRVLEIGAPIEIAVEEVDLSARRVLFRIPA